MKTSVLAAVLLSMGMGMAHAADIGDSASVVVSGSIGAPTCALDIDKPGIKLGSVSSANFVANNALVSPQNFTVSLTGCAAEVDLAGNMKRNVDLKIMGTNTADGKKYFGKGGAAAGSIAVGLEVKGTPGLLETDAKVQLADLGDPFVGAKKDFTVGLVAKDISKVKTGESVSVPLTFQLVTR
ncbi:fimbrial protein [Photorhabdus noenieputensis]|uniref:fimbrial protein n=1 Tax=Photorhabdus noenieputensis TaxID=1208607 RepID=UPI002001C883|nr:fimbrial protein [Photorhabdus noenieputensis]MCK3667677.1 hypothetical protein [Photorhabdus noenieputensis]